MTAYDIFKRVDESTKLGKFFNLVLSNLEISRILHAPKTFIRKDSALYEHLPCSEHEFYRLCLLEIYLHSIISNLHRWKEETKEYINEFSCRWRYYASAKRLESIREYGGGEEDYKPDGSIKTAVGNEVLSHYHIAEYLAPDMNDIFTQTELSDLIFISGHLITESKMDISDMLQGAFGGERPKSYRMENGKMIQNEWTDDILRKVQNENDAWLTVDTLFGVFHEVATLVNTVKNMSRTDDHEAFFRRLPGKIQDLIDLNIEPLPLSETILKQQMQ
ncbi:MAG: hypothetical protein LBP83_05135 [Dysgonamonadaceae bacterium]|jgi:hypothetical protein|nr:hypothetical protein [Dysgonamonadaceae bacterium]